METDIKKLQERIKELETEIEEDNRLFAKFFNKPIKLSKNLKDPIKVIDKAVDLGLIFRSGDLLILDDSGSQNVTDAWENLEDWVNQQRVIRLKIGDKAINKILKHDIGKGV